MGQRAPLFAAGPERSEQRFVDIIGRGLGTDDGQAAMGLVSDVKVLDQGVAYLLSAGVCPVERQ